MAEPRCEVGILSRPDVADGDGLDGSGFLWHLSGSQGSFVGVGEDTGILDWVSLSFFTALARDYPDIVPASAGARALAAFQLLPSVGWALVVFAAVMSSIQRGSSESHAGDLWTTPIERPGIRRST